LANLSYATAIGSDAVVGFSNTILLGRHTGEDTVRIPGNLTAFGDSNFSFATFENSAHFNSAAEFNGGVYVNSLASGGSTNLCLGASNRIATCSSSLRYKADVRSFFGGLDLVRRLRPITFDWKEGGMHDVGFAAEEVNAVEPLLTTRNSKGEIEGVKYAQITTVLVNAVKEQQSEIEAQRRANESQTRQIAEQKELLRLQQQQLDELKRIVCQQNAKYFGVPCRN